MKDVKRRLEDLTHIVAEYEVSGYFGTFLTIFLYAKGAYEVDVVHCEFLFENCEIVLSSIFTEYLYQVKNNTIQYCAKLISFKFVNNTLLDSSSIVLILHYDVEYLIDL